LVFEERTIYLSAVPDAMHVDFTVTPPGSWLIGHVPWTEAEHKIFALNANTTVAGALDINIGDACLVVERKTWRLGESITRVRQVFPGNAYHLMARFTPSQD
jgi:GntR family histidine utilization transcriptional repressor